MASSEDKTAYKCGGGNQSGMMSGVMLKGASSVRKSCKTMILWTDLYMNAAIIKTGATTQL